MLYSVFFESWSVKVEASSEEEAVEAAKVALVEAIQDDDVEYEVVEYEVVEGNGEDDTTV